MSEKERTEEGKDDNAGAAVKRSIVFEPGDYAWAEARAKDLYGRRGLGLYIRMLVREDRKREARGI